LLGDRRQLGNVAAVIRRAHQRLCPRRYTITSPRHDFWTMRRPVYFLGTCSVFISVCLSTCCLVLFLYSTIRNLRYDSFR